MRLDSMLEPRSKLRQRPRLQEFAGTVVAHLPRQSDDNERAVCSVDRVQNPNANTRGVPGGRSAACATNAVLACFGNSTEKLRFL